MDRSAIEPLLTAGTVKAQRHPTAPLTVYNYSALCQYERRWCPVSRACRGLILHDEGYAVARPFPKFHNYEEHPRSELAFSRPFVVSEKMDGSLGILYAAPAGWAIATRGSFISDQAVWATAFLRHAYPDWEPLPGLTYLFEILYPRNRIVVDYQGREDLVLLATLDTATGRDTDQFDSWPGPRAPEFITAAKPREVRKQLSDRDTGNHEGVVLRFDWPKTGPQLRVKVKLAEYVRLHRLLFGCSTKTVWEALSSGQSLEELTSRVPDEFYHWLQHTVGDLQARYAEQEQVAQAEFAHLADAVGLADRKAFAQLAATSPQRALLFKLLDGQSVSDLIWKDLKPESTRPFRYQGEDVA